MTVNLPLGWTRTATRTEDRWGNKLGLTVVLTDESGTYAGCYRHTNYDDRWRVDTEPLASEQECVDIITERHGA